MNIQQNVNQYLSLLSLLGSQTPQAEKIKEKAKANRMAKADTKKAEREAEVKKKQAGTEAEFAEAQEGFSEAKAGIAYRRFVATGEGKEELEKAEAQLEIDRDLAYNLRHQEELDKIAREDDEKHNIEHVPSPAQAKAEQNRKTAEENERKRIEESNAAIELIRRSGTWYTGGQRLDNE